MRYVMYSSLMDNKQPMSDSVGSNLMPPQKPNTSTIKHPTFTYAVWTQTWFLIYLLIEALQPRKPVLINIPSLQSYLNLVPGDAYPSVTPSTPLTTLHARTRRLLWLARESTFTAISHL